MASPTPIDLDVDDLPLEVFNPPAAELTIESLTGGHGMPENAASCLCGGGAGGCAVSCCSCVGGSPPSSAGCGREFE